VEDVLDPRDGTGFVYRRLREAIMSGELPAGAGMSQVSLARQFGISRSPVREALRLLEREGLVEVRVNQRPRVAVISVDEVEGLYALRIVLEPLALAVSVPRFGPADRAVIERTLAEMDGLAGVDLPRWEASHRAFHHALVAHAGAPVVGRIDELFDHSDRYRRMHQARTPQPWAMGRRDHHAIARAACDGDAARASALLAHHLARTALFVLALIDADHEPELVQQALRQATAIDRGSAGAEGAPAGLRRETERESQAAER
jgi:DNA-binding GntR family transcriptional regulator